MGEQGSLGPSQRMNGERNGRGSGESAMMRQILKTCQKIDAQVSSLSKLEAENSSLMTSLNHIEANFLMLLRTSQAEIAKLKRELQSRGKTYVHATSRRPRKSTLDPHRTIDHMDLIDCLHTPVNYESATNSKSQPVQRRSDVQQPSHLRQQKRRHSSSSSSGSSSSASSSSSSSSPSSSSVSDSQKRHPNQESLVTNLASQKTSVVSSNANLRHRAGETRFISATNFLQKRRPSMANCSASFQNSRENRSLGNSSKLARRSPKPRVTMTAKSVPSASYAVSSAEESCQNHKQVNAVPAASSIERSTADATTGIGNDPEAHLQRLVRASVRSARDHHSASIVFAPPLKGRRLTGEEKSIVDAYLRAEEHRCIAMAKRARSQSPQRSQPFSPTIFSLRQMIKRSSLCSPPSFPAPSTANTVGCSLNVSTRSHAAPKTPPDEEEEEVVDEADMQSGGDAPPAFPCRGAPHTPEDEYVQEEEVGEEFCSQVNPHNTGALHEDEVNNGHNLSESPRIEIEEEISDAGSHHVPNANEGEAMSEGEVDDEEEEAEDEGRTERTNHERSHHGLARHSHQRQHVDSRSSSHRHQLKLPTEHRSRRQPVSSHDRRRNADGSNHSSLLTAKRARRRSEERDSYNTRTRYSSPPLPPPLPPARRPRTHRAPVVNGTSSTRRHRFSSSGGKYADVLVARGRLAPVFASHRSAAVGIRNCRRPPTQRSFAQRR